jgi:hypothetical protein
VNNIVALKPRSYEAKLQRLNIGGVSVHIAGTLDGFIDFAIGPRTYTMTRDDARSLIAALHTTIGDIQANCLFDRDPLLAPVS